ncbi:MAG: hypothetical protein A1D16_00065 [Flavihumibacter sp. CACIAM 22H1]|nr:MAG: hypothetical protein A1D16_00065 [Flavihumibacter sp. CACIAM 22H1]
MPVQLVVAQSDTSDVVKKRYKSYSDLLNSITQLEYADTAMLSYIDSIAVKKYKEAFVNSDSTILKEMISLPSILKIPLFGKPLFSFNGGYINYQWNFRSGIDTPFVEKNISQHLITGTASVTVANAIPLRVTYFERQSNSTVFRDFRDVRVELDVAGFQKLKEKRLKEYLLNKYDQTKDPFLRPFKEQVGNRISRYKSWLNYSGIRKKIIDSREVLSSPDLIIEKPGVNKDSILQAAQKFVTFYESVAKNMSRHQKIYDSLNLLYKAQERKYADLKALLQSNLNAPEALEKLSRYATETKLTDQGFDKMVSSFSAVKTLAVGKTMPNLSSLTVKNTNIRGVDFEYNKNNIYLALVAGRVDLRVRDFVYNNQRGAPQYVYAIKAGYGNKHGNNLLLSYFAGKKQLFATGSGMQVQQIKGVSLSSQLKITRTTKLMAEIAQSASPDLVAVSGASKAEFNFKDNKNLAYSIGLVSFIPSTRTRLEAQFQHQGVNFQNFTNYRPNAASDNWSVKAEQYVWKRHVKFVAGFRKNDFVNSYVLQRYNANTIYKHVSGSFQKRGWPSISVSYMPSSQFAIVDSLVYEHQYQVLTSSINHQYQLGTAVSNSTFSYNRFYNDAADSGFLYFNSKNIYLNQSVRFSFYTANLSVIHSDNGNYVLNVLDGGLLFHTKRQNTIGFGVKTNSLNKEALVKIGYYGSARFTISKIGELSIWAEKSYLPTMHSRLGKNEFYTVSFTRYFN